MLELLKKIGVPATISAIIAALVTMVPILFKVDERYAKADDMHAAVAKLDKDNDELRHELAQAVGFQQAMVALIQSEKTPRVSFDGTGGYHMLLTAGDMSTMGTMLRVAAPPAAPASAASAPPRKDIERPRSWMELNEAIARQQQRLAK
jgi:hypothetical protein